jgi:hypothetical protein
MKMRFEFGQYMARAREVLVTLPNLMREHMHYYVYPFFQKSWEVNAGWYFKEQETTVDP